MIESPNKSTHDVRPWPKLSFRFSIRFFLILFVLIGIALTYISGLIRRENPIPLMWDCATGKNIKWIAPLGSQTYATPTIHKGRIFIGSNNGHGYDPAFPPDVDLGVMLCFDAKNGNFLWQHVNHKLAEGRSQDWPLQGITSRACADQDRIWFVSNRCEVICLDTEGFYDNQNDGVNSEISTGNENADVVWQVDMRKRFGVRPHNLSHCNVVVDESRVYVKTNNGVDETHRNVPAPNAPSFVVLDKVTGKTIWTDNSPKCISHGSWGSPALATIAGKRQVLFPGGDGWLYSFEPAGDGKGNSKLLWKFDCNEKTAKWMLHGMGTRNNLLTAPTVSNEKVFVTMGQDPEHGIGSACVWCISPGKLRGDISPTIVKRNPNSPPIGWENNFQHCNLATGDVEIPNPNSGLVWKYAGFDSNGDGTVDDNDSPTMNRSLSEVIVRNDRAYINDQFGVTHCLDAKTGKYEWHEDCLSALWNSPLVTDDGIYIADEDGKITVLGTEKIPTKLQRNQTLKHSSIYATPVSHQGVLYLASRVRLIAIEFDEPDPKKRP